MEGSRFAALRFGGGGAAAKEVGASGDGIGDSIDTQSAARQGQADAAAHHHLQPPSSTRHTSTCAHSCPIRPSLPAAPEDPVDGRKLRVALAHSFLVVSVFCSAWFLDDGDGDGDGDGG
ncbi:hypothetical protein OsJ_30756 [Oryza sativa Japonica Group]|uniref:Uncharacterized protein n=1 Tax=Oryza sativa subsp. japonica TaxID=39947 RepID=B9G7J9_ORYSJ|nr:hypothetical protein OsJ_30756 [Oryza sativa Japonica Group]